RIEGRSNTRKRVEGISENPIIHCSNYAVRAGQCRAEIALSHCRCRHGGDVGFLLASSLAFITSKEKRSVLTDRAAQHAAELIAAETRFVARTIAACIALEAGTREVVACIED